MDRVICPPPISPRLYICREDASVYRVLLRHNGFAAAATAGGGTTLLPPAKSDYARCAAALAGWRVREVVEVEEGPCGGGGLVNSAKP